MKKCLTDLYLVAMVYRNDALINPDLVKALHTESICSKPSPTAQLAPSSPSFMLLSGSLMTQTSIIALAIFSDAKVDVENATPIANTETGPDMHPTPLTLRLLAEVRSNKARDAPR